MNLVSHVLAASIFVASTVTAGAESDATSIAGVRLANPFDSSTWYDASTCDMMNAKIDFNFADPSFWVSFINPETHSCNHMALTNPATYGQFFEVSTYTDMMDPAVWMKWVDLDTYKPVAKAQTIAYWMQPGAYMHAVKVEHYTQLADPKAHVAMLETPLNYIRGAFASW